MLWSPKTTGTVPHARCLMSVAVSTRLAASPSPSAPWVPTRHTEPKVRAPERPSHLQLAMLLLKREWTIHLMGRLPLPGLCLMCKCASSVKSRSKEEESLSEIKIAAQFGTSSLRLFTRAFMLS